MENVNSKHPSSYFSVEMPRVHNQLTPYETEVENDFSEVFLILKMQKYREKVSRNHEIKSWNQL